MLVDDINKYSSGAEEKDNEWDKDKLKSNLDKLLYIAKRQGRDRIIFEDEAETD